MTQCYVYINDGLCLYFKNPRPTKCLPINRKAELNSKNDVTDRQHTLIEVGKECSKVEAIKKGVFGNLKMIITLPINIRVK